MLNSMTVVPSPGATSFEVNAPVIMDLLVIGLALPRRVPGGRNRRGSDRSLPGAGSLPRPPEQGAAVSKLARPGAAGQEEDRQETGRSRQTRCRRRCLVNTS